MHIKPFDCLRIHYVWKLTVMYFLLSFLHSIKYCAIKGTFTLYILLQDEWTKTWKMAVKILVSSVDGTGKQPCALMREQEKTSFMRLSSNCPSKLRTSSQQTESMNSPKEDIFHLTLYFCIYRI